MDNGDNHYDVGKISKKNVVMNTKNKMWKKKK